ncbi:MAG: hypothetical protein GY730_06910, partial [bacterium]|nr:hypothetical protein [bacterium]
MRLPCRGSDRNFSFLVMEYMPVISLEDLSKDNASLYLNRKTCEELGRMFAMDVFLNNDDRMNIAPLTGSNPGNILFHEDPERQEICVMDTEASPLSNEPSNKSSNEPQSSIFNIKIKMSKFKNLIKDLGNKSTKPILKCNKSSLLGARVDYIELMINDILENHNNSKTVMKSLVSGKNSEQRKLRMASDI